MFEFSSVKRSIMFLPCLVGLVGGVRTSCLAQTYTFSNTFGSTGSGNGQFSAPLGIALDSSKNIYIADFSNNRIEEFSNAGAFIKSVTDPIGGGGPTAIALDGSNNWYVAHYNTSGGSVEKFNSAGTYGGVFASTGVSPYGLALGPSGNVYVENSATNVSVFNSSGTLINTISGHITDADAIRLDNSGNLYVTDDVNNSNSGVKEFNSSGTFLRTIGTGIVGST